MEISQHVRAILSFVEAADTSSFSAAARKLGISPAAVSKNIAGLEKVLGVRLMNRTTRKINLTEEGASFLLQARHALDTLENAVDGIVARKMQTSGHVRISTSAALGRNQLIPALPELLSRYPGLTVEIDMDDRVTDLVRDGYDIAIRGGNILDSSLITRPVCHFKSVLVASPAYLASHGVPQSPEELTQHRLIARRFLGGSVNPWLFRQEDGSLIAVDPAPAAVTLSAPEALVQAACAGLGIVQVGIHHAHAALEQGLLNVVLSEQHFPGNFELVIQYPHRALIAPRVRVTVEYLLDVLRRDPSLNYPLDHLSRYQYQQ